MKTLTSKEFIKQNQTRTAKKIKTTGSNQLTKNAIQFLTLNGFVCFRNNVTGIFDTKQAAAKLANKNLPISTVIKILSSCYRKSHERKGVADIIGFQKKTGVFLAIEIKFGKDKLSADQINFLTEVVKNGGIAIVAKTFDQFVKDLNSKTYFSNIKN
jgi:hypothetical protein